MLTQLYDLCQLAEFCHLCHLAWSGCTQIIITASLPWLGQLCPVLYSYPNLEPPTPSSPAWPKPGGHQVRDLRHLLRQHIRQDVDGVRLGLGGGGSSQEDLQQSDLQGRAGRKGNPSFSFTCPNWTTPSQLCRVSPHQDKCGELPQL